MQLLLYLVNKKASKQVCRKSSSLVSQSWKAKNGYTRKAEHSRRCRQIRCFVFIERIQAQFAKRRNGLRSQFWHLPHVERRRALHFAIESAFQQCLQVRLRILRQSAEQRHSASDFYPQGTHQPHAGILPSQLHRRAFFEFRGYWNARLHDGTFD